MRCSECDQIITRQSSGRLKDGRIVFGWCRGCFEVAGAVETELTAAVRLFDSQNQRQNRIAIPFGGTSWDSTAAGSRQRMLALTCFAIVLGIWGLTMLGVGFTRVDEPTPLNPLGKNTSGFLIGGGGALLGTACGLFLGVWRVRHKFRKKNGQAENSQRKIIAHGSGIPQI